MIKILGFGNSLTAGTPGYDPEHGWGDPKSQYGYWLLKHAREDGWNNISFNNKGIPGELACWMPNRLRHILKSSTFQCAIILGGSNDIGWQDTTNQIVTYLQELWQIARENRIEVIACTVPPIGVEYPSIQSAQKELNRLIVNHANESEGIVIADTHHALAGTDGLLKGEYDSGDSLHLNVKGYRRMGEVIWKNSLQPLINEKFPV